MCACVFSFFFFQAEDGIRDADVTGVQTCALPISIGPNLDNAFAADVKQGYPQSSIENVVLDQIRLGSGPLATYTTIKNGKGFTPQTPMPANLVQGKDAIDV